MHLKRGLRKVRALLGRAPARKRTMTKEELVFRHIWHRLAHAFDRRTLLQRGRPNALILQMGKVASTSIQSALLARGINAFHSHGLSSATHHGQLSALLEKELTFRVAAHDLRRHIQSIALRMMVRWYQEHKTYKSHKLRVLTLTRDPVSHYPSAFLHRRDGSLPGIYRWYRERMKLSNDAAVSEVQALTDFLMELMPVLVEGRPSDGAAGWGRCIALAQQRLPNHPVAVTEIAAILVPLRWIDEEINEMFGVDILASSSFRERGWAEQSHDWVDVMAVKFESLAALVPEIQRFFGLAELALPRENLTHGRAGASDVAEAWQAVMATPVGQAAARELRTSPYGRACGYDQLA